MKKALILLLVLTMALGILAGCQNTGAQNATGGTNGTTAPPPTEATGTGKDDVTNQGRYTVSDEDAIAAKDTVVATCDATIPLYCNLPLNHTPK